MGFTKLDSGILQSSIMAEDPKTFKVWIAILASTGPDGIARVSSSFLSASCYLTLAAVDKAIAILESPDPRSRSINDDGRRIERIDGGYGVINYDKYREFSPQEGNPNSPGAIRTRRWREAHQNVTISPVVTDGDVTSVTSASASGKEKALDSSLTLEQSKKRTEIIVAVISYLNEKTGKKFNPKAAEAVKHIGGRISEGRTLEDFKRVIDVKVAKWKGKSWKDGRPGRAGEIVQGDDLLRPKTLFASGNFENYVNESLPKEPKAEPDKYAHLGREVE